MLNRKHRLPALLAGVTLAVAACGGGSGDGSGNGEGSGSQEPLAIGVIKTGTGGAAFYSEETLEGLELALKEINADGGIDGREVRLVVEDDQNNPTLTPAITRSLADEGVVAIVSASGSASTLQAKPVFAQLQIPGIAPTNLNPAIAEPPNNEFMFMMASTSTQVSAALAEALGEYERIGIFTDTSPTGAQLADGYQATFKESGVNVVAKEAIDVGATDASAAIGRFKDARVDAVFVSGQGAPEQSLFVRQAEEQGLGVPLFQDPTAALPAYWELVGEAGLAGLSYATYLDPDNPATAELEAKFPDGMQPENAAGYDVLYLLKQAIESADSTDGTAIRDSLESMSGYEPHFGQEGYTLSCESRVCSSVQGLVVRSFDNGEPGEVIFRPSSD